MNFNPDDYDLHVTLQGSEEQLERVGNLLSKTIREEAGLLQQGFSAMMPGRRTYVFLTPENHEKAKQRFLESDRNSLGGAFPRLNIIGVT